ncbi:UvrD-helicase domain-containing protein [Spirochaetota bacterium]
MQNKINAKWIKHKPKNISLTEEFINTLNVLEKTYRNLFITGKAGTGKSTLLELFRDNTNKKIVVLAPTGVAALKVGGMTIHKFFKLPWRPIKVNDAEIKKLAKTIRKPDIYQKLDAIIIDEVSMVRADLIDGIDYFMRIVRGSKEPFGGVQVVFIGDLHQLPPVVSKKEEKKYFMDVYESEFFFSAKVFNSFNYEIKDLSHIFRQSNKKFISILNSIRNAEGVEDALDILNTRYTSDDNVPKEGILLTTTNKLANQINTDNLENITDQKLHEFKARIEHMGKGKKSTSEIEEKYPADVILKLKVGAQVMFVKNDSENRWVNGTLGRVKKIEGDEILINVKGQGLCEVKQETWERLEYDYDSKKKEIITHVIGKFTQFPLKLAWAITIHKSQGCTFDNVRIEVGRGAFASGQVYVALSRCTSLEGITLASKIFESDIKVNRKVVDYLREHFAIESNLVSKPNNNKQKNEKSEIKISINNQKFNNETKEKESLNNANNIVNNKKFEYSQQQLEVINTTDKDVQVIACAGSGKTESVAQRIASLIIEGESPESIIAFTFTEKAASELKERIYKRIEEVKGHDYLGRLAPMFVGTIHSYCFHLLQVHIHRYGNYDVLDEHRHIGLISREYYNLYLKDIGNRHWSTVRDFAWTTDVIGNELINETSLTGFKFTECYKLYSEMLHDLRFLTFSGIISNAVNALGDSNIFAKVHGPLRHLIVDEYQDINPAQEKLIELLSKDPVRLCVVGDDDQSIYQWRGSEVDNIINFLERRPNAHPIKLEDNRRSRPQIIQTANNFVKSIPKRIIKEMNPVRPNSNCQIVTWEEETPEAEAEKIAETINNLKDKGFRFKDISVLYRSVRTSAPELIEAFDKMRIPYNCGGRTGIFLQPEINLFGEIIAWFVDGEWKDERYGQARESSLINIVNGLNKHFSNDRSEIPSLKKYLKDWKHFRLLGNRPVSLISDFYRLLNYLGINEMDSNAPQYSALFGSFARFSELLGDFEHVNRRGRFTIIKGKRKFITAKDRGKSYYNNLYSYVRYYAIDAYEDFEGELIHDMDAVDILTIHQAKGLEWPIVFLPSLTSQRFPSMYAGKKQNWMLPEDVLSEEKRSRYEGGDADERRLFYVALTRARDTVYLSTFNKIKKNTKISPYLKEVAADLDGIQTYSKLPMPPLPKKKKKSEDMPLEIGFSDIVFYNECGYRYRLNNQFGFQQELATELGYGRAIHHILRLVAEKARSNNTIPTMGDVEKIMNYEFYLPFARNPEHYKMYNSAINLVKRYVNEYSDDLLRVWETERPFQLQLSEGRISGRADIIFYHDEGKPDNLVFVDYKTSSDPHNEEYYQMQMQVYATAARDEGLDVVAGYIHDLKAADRIPVNVGIEESKKAVEKINKTVNYIRKGKFKPKPEEEKCLACDYKLICKYNKASK